MPGRRGPLEGHARRAPRAAATHHSSPRRHHQNRRPGPRPRLAEHVVQERGPRRASAWPARAALRKYLRACKSNLIRRRRALHRPAEREARPAWSCAAASFRKARLRPYLRINAHRGGTGLPRRPSPCSQTQSYQATPVREPVSSFARPSRRRPTCLVLTATHARAPPHGGRRARPRRAAARRASVARGARPSPPKLVSPPGISLDFLSRASFSSSSTAAAAAWAGPVQVGGDVVLEVLPNTSGPAWGFFLTLCGRAPAPII